MTTFIEQMQERARDRIRPVVTFAPGTDKKVVHFAQTILDEFWNEQQADLNKLVAELVTATLKEVERVIDEEDPNVGMDRQTSPAFWGNKLRARIQALSKVTGE